MNKEGKVFSEYDLVPIIEEILQSGGTCKLKVTGSSMTPILKHKKDSVLLISPRLRDVEKGEIVFIRRKGGKHVLHRVYKIIDDEFFIMNGDAQMWVEKVGFDQVLGVAKYIYKGHRQISCDNFIYKFVVKIWMILMPLRGKIFALRNFLKKV